jgi:hypothetical protein
MTELTHEHDTVEETPTSHRNAVVEDGSDRHVHGAPQQTVVVRDEGRPGPEVAIHRAGPGAVAARIVLVVVGAGLLFAGALLDWLRGIAGTELSYRVFYRTELLGGASFLVSAGAIVMLLAVIALLGLATGSGWLSRLAGALALAAFALAAFALFVVQAVRGDAVSLLPDLRLGIWLVLIGAIVTLIGGFVGPFRTVIREGGTL